MKHIRTLWKFSRPHTIGGTVISLSTLYVIASEEHGLGIRADLWLLSIITGICCNIFIVGINQIQDIEIDRINKPYLPLVSGELTVPTAKIIVYSCAVLSLIISAFVSFYLMLVIAAALAIGWAYSMPPLYLKQHHLPAAIAVTTVRGLIVNLGAFMIFNYKINNSLDIPWNVKVLTGFIIAFSIAISWFKDLPDVEGDERHHIKTLAILYSGRFALIAGNIIVMLAYIFSVCVNYINLLDSGATRQNTVLLYGHASLGLLFILNSFSIKISSRISIKKFYMRFWLFFFAEYILYLTAYI